MSLLGTDLWTTNVALPNPFLVNSPWIKYINYFESNFGQVVNFSHVVGNELSEISIKTSEIETVEASASFVFGSQEEIVIIFSVWKSNCVFSQSTGLPAEDVVHIEWPIISNPAEFVACWNFSFSFIGEANSDSVIEIMLLGDKVSTCFKNDVLEIFLGLIAAIKVKSLEVAKLAWLKSIIIVNFDFIVLRSEVESSTSWVPDGEPKLNFSTGLIAVVLLLGDLF